MPNNSHTYSAYLTWTGNRGSGTSHYRAYERAHEIRFANKPAISCSSDPAFRGDPTRHNPEELLVASVSSCHMLWFLHLASDAGVVVVEYTDDARGTMEETTDGGGHFTEVVLRPTVTTTTEVEQSRMNALHERAHALCYIARSVNFPVRVEGRVRYRSSPR
jgi:organic hydroperoxide reductase OsmC/OhrA